MSEFENKSTEDLEKLQAAINLALRGKFAERVEKVKEQISVLAKEEKVSNEVFVRDYILGKKGRLPKVEKEGAAVAHTSDRIVNPENPSQVYNGRGRPPEWLTKMRKDSGNKSFSTTFEAE